MEASEQQSLSNIHTFDPMDPSTSTHIDDDAYRTMVLRFEQTEDEVDQRFLQTALELGINVPQDPETTLDLVGRGISGLDINVEPSEPVVPPPSTASPSIHTGSDSSIEQTRHAKTPSLAATSITSVSSVASKKSHMVKVRKGFRRISRFHRRRTLAEPVPDVPPRASSMLVVKRPILETRRTVTSDRIETMSDPQPHAITTDQMRPLTMPHALSISGTYSASPPPASIVASASPAEEDSLETLAGRRRSISNPILKKLRTTQLQEQLRFLSFEASQHRLMRTKQLQQKRDALSQYQQQQQEFHTRHADALTSLENRHLTAEVELHRTLQLERQACDTRLKHMQAYCNPRSTVEGMPSRVVSKADYRQLEQQYHIRNGMDNLHTSRINVLRERQGKQLERIMAKQEKELEALESDFERTNQELDVKFRDEESQLQRDLSDRKVRLIARWNISEAIERRRLELQTGDDYGPLPTISWSSNAATRDSSPVAPISPVSSSSRISSLGDSVSNT